MTSRPFCNLSHSVSFFFSNSAILLSFPALNCQPPQLPVNLDKSDRFRQLLSYQLNQLLDVNMVAPVSDLMPKTRLGNHWVSRLIVGGNPFSGNSHLSPESSLEMRDYHSSQRVLETLRLCEKWGISAFQSRGDSHMIRLVNDYRIAGGNLAWIAQTASEMADFRTNVQQIARAGAIAIYLHGTRTDALWQQGRPSEILESIKVMRDQGVTVGLGTHIPEVITHAEEQGWDLDFYMACFYNLSRTTRESALVGGVCQGSESCLSDDRKTMCQAIRATDKPVLAFKILAASRLSQTPQDLRAAFAYAFANIKPKDAIVVGVFTKYGNQVAENARLVFEFGAPSRST